MLRVLVVLLFAIIGVVSMCKNNAVAMNYAIPSNDAIEFIKKTERNEEIKILN